MLEGRIVSPLIGLVGAMNNNGKTASTDIIIKEALSAAIYNTKQDENYINELRQKIIKEKYAISPDCAICKAPCGNTSDYDMNRFYNEPNTAVKELKEKIIYELSQYALNIDTKGELPILVYKGLAFFSYDLQENSYEELLENFRQELAK